MAKCIKCGKKGLFLKLENGLCVDCLNKTSSIKETPTPIKDSQNGFLPERSFCDFKPHPDIADLLWFIDGSQKNYDPLMQAHINQSDSEINIKYSAHFYNNDEPSAISIKYPIEETDSDVAPPPYSPTYAILSARQRWIYWKFLENPFIDRFDVGYLFILYYGLERHLLYGNFEKAFNTIIRLREAHKNSSFQSYSFNALLNTCIIKQRYDLFEELCNNQDKNASVLPINLFLAYKYVTKQAMSAAELMTYARRFEFTNTSYINDYPSLFEKTLEETIKIKYAVFFPYKFLKNTKKYTELRIFANASLQSSISFPDYIEHFEFKRISYSLLSDAHEKVKQELKANRSSYQKAERPIMPTTIYADLDTYPEIEIYNNFKNSYSDTNAIATYSEKRLIDLHYTLQFAVMKIYKYREHPLALKHIIELCMLDIDILEKRPNYLSNGTEYNGDPHFGNPHIDSLYKLVSIYEKMKDFQKAIEICELGIKHKVPIHHNHNYFSNKLISLEKKASKQ